MRLRLCRTLLTLAARRLGCGRGPLTLLADKLRSSRARKVAVKALRIFAEERVPGLHGPNLGGRFLIPCREIFHVDLWTGRPVRIGKRSQGYFSSTQRTVDERFLLV